MRLLVATGEWFPDFFGGSGRVAAATAQRLATKGHDVTVIAPRHPGKPEETEENGIRMLRTLPRNAMPETLTDVAGARRVANSLRGESFDVVIAHHTPVAVGVLTATIEAPLALIYHASPLRELRFLRPRLPFGPRRLAKYPLELPVAVFERMAVKGATRILVLSEFSRSLLHADHPRHSEKVVRVLGGVDVTRFTPINDARVRLGIASDAPLIVTARRLEPRMGIEELLHALTRLAEAKLVVIGTGVSESALRRLTASLGLEKRVQFIGRVDDDDLRTWYAAADVVAVPTIAYEGFGLVTAEALACGTPVVATAVGASPELLDPLDPDLVAHDGSAVGFAEVLGHAIAAAGPDIAVRCRDYAVSRFDWDVVIDDWERALEVCASLPARDALAVT
jgi:glycosyltransferase involved in cell wall biosynthesis